MMESKGRILTKTVFGTMLCILYLALHMLLRSIFEVSKILEYGKAYQFSSLYSTLCALVLWLPFVIGFVKATVKKEWKWLFGGTKKFFSQHWREYAVYLSVLFVIWGRVELGVLYLDAPLIGAVWFPESAQNYVLMCFLGHIFDSVGVVLFLVLVPVLCYIENAARAPHPSLHP